MKEELDDEMVLWSKAIIAYCKQSCTKSRAIQSVIKDTDLNCKLPVCLALYVVQ